MRLLSIDSARFGTLDIAVPLEFAPGLNVCIAPNQAGKSTLLTLLEWTLYGVPGRGTKKDQQLVEQWCPWNGGAASADIVLAPEHADWPEQARLKVNFAEFAPHLENADTLKPLRGDKFINVARNGTWDLGQRFTGLSRRAFAASLMARQEEMDNVLREAELRMLLTADLAELVEDPERASLESSLRLLTDPKFTMADLATGEVQLPTLLRRAVEHHHLATGQLEAARVRLEQMAGLLARRGEEELALRELQEHMDSLAEEGSRLELAVAHWHLKRQAWLSDQLTEWQPRLEAEPWLTEFPGEKEREIEGWLADRRLLDKQRATAEALAKEAAALKLRAPYVEQVNPDRAADMAVQADRVEKRRSEITALSERHQRSAAMLKDIDGRLQRGEKIADQLKAVGELGELQSALQAAQDDRATADASVTEYGVGTETAQRNRLNELEEIIAPHNEIRSQVAEHISTGTQLGDEHRELTSQRDVLDAKAKAGGQALAITGGLLVIIGILAAVFGGTVLSPEWLAYAVGGVLLIGGGVLAVFGIKRNGQASAARAELTKVVEPKLDELAERAEVLSTKAAAMCEQQGITTEAWDELIAAFPEYQQLTFEMQQYHEALHQRTLAEQRQLEKWSRVAELCPDAGSAPDMDWLARRIAELNGLEKYRQARQDEHAKLRDSETELERLRGEEREALGQLSTELSPLALGDMLEKEPARALREYNRMCEETKRYRELVDKARETGQLDVQERDLVEKLGRLLAPLGLGEQAASEPDVALREFEKRRDDSTKYAALIASVDEAAEQIRHLPVTREDYGRRWQLLPQEVRDELAGLAADEADCAELLERRRSIAENFQQTQGELGRRRKEVNALRVEVAKDEDAESDYNAALEAHEAAVERLQRVEQWKRALVYLRETFSGLSQDLAGNLAPLLREELHAVMAYAPVAGVLQADFSNSLELLIKVNGAPPGLAGAELIERLSVGARRQLALALRLAVAKALGSERRPLLLLDEPLAELDDAHAVACLQYIAKLSETHQVLLTTCHTQHHTWLSQQSGIEAHTVSLA